MNYSKIISSALFASSISILSIFAIETDKANAGACPSPSTYTSMLGTESTSWLNDSDLEGGCDGTPEVYGVTVYKMGLCTADPFAAISHLGTAAGLSPDFSSCSWTYVNSDGEYESFAAGGYATLSEGTSSLPSIPAGSTSQSYPFAVIELGPTFHIQDSYGPIKPLTTSTTEVTYVTSSSSSTAATSGSPGTRLTPINTFMGLPGDVGSEDGAEVCNASDQVDPISGKGTITGWLLDVDGETIADNAAITSCSGVNRLIGVMDLQTSAQGPGPVTVTTDTSEIRATFVVTDNGSGIYYKGLGGGCIITKSESL